MCEFDVTLFDGCAIGGVMMQQEPGL